MARKATRRAPRKAKEPALNMEKPFCVIGPVINPDPHFTRQVGRHFVATVDEGVRHAARLLDDQRNRLTDELYVVKVVRVVRKRQNYDLFSVL